MQQLCNTLIFLKFFVLLDKHNKAFDYSEQRSGRLSQHLGLVIKSPGLFPIRLFYASGLNNTIAKLVIFKIVLKYD